MKRTAGIMDKFVAIATAPHVVAQIGLHPCLQPQTQANPALVTDPLFAVIVNHEIPILPCLEQIKRLSVQNGIIPAYPLNIDLPLIRTLQWLRLTASTFSWMSGRTFKALKTYIIHESQGELEDLSRHLACTSLELRNISV